MVDKTYKDISELSVKDLAEQHLEEAITQLGKLVKSEDPRISLEASQNIIDMARPDFPRRGGGGFWPGGWPGGWPGDFGGIRTG